MFYVV